MSLATMTACVHLTFDPDADFTLERSYTGGWILRIKFGGSGATDVCVFMEDEHSARLESAVAAGREDDSREREAEERAEVDHDERLSTEPAGDRTPARDGEG